MVLVAVWRPYGSVIVYEGEMGFHVRPEGSVQSLGREN